MTVANTILHFESMKFLDSDPICSFSQDDFVKLQALSVEKV